MFAREKETSNGCVHTLRLPIFPECLNRLINPISYEYPSDEINGVTYRVWIRFINESEIDSIHINSEGVGLKLYHLEPKAEIKETYKISVQTSWESAFSCRLYTKDSLYSNLFGYHSNSNGIQKKYT